MTKRSAAWLMLLASAVLEAVWATALGNSDGFTHLLPTLVFAALQGSRGNRFVL
ncbi:UNVERIFIED_ORG: multidrug transporter EmrE-like cation transporter [Arthrobacter sp. UYEF10]